MEKVISFTKRAQLQALTASEYLGYTVQPLIQEILDQIVKSDNLDMVIADAAKKYPTIAETFFDIDPSNVAASFSLKEPLLFPEQNPVVSLSFNNTKLAQFFPVGVKEIIKEQSVLPDIHYLLYLCGQAKFNYDQICQQVSDDMIILLDKLIKSHVVQTQPQPARGVPVETSGVFRLQHAALLYRTKTTGILVDPQLHSNYGLANLKQDITRAMLEGFVDAILISHSHYDHWNLPTLMQFAPEIPIIVPKVPRGSITCEDMKARLEGLGFDHVIAVDWYAEPIVIGDIEINVLPFYGEQPLVPEYNQPKHPDLRNWGNTYLIRTPDYTSWFLIDAGNDPMGSMRDVAEYVRQKFGIVDQVLSNFLSLSYNSIGTDLSSWGADIVGNLLSNPQIFSVTNKTDGFHLATLGAKGVAEICSIVGARACLPYAHSWAELGQYTGSDESLIKDVIAELEKVGCSTQVIPWKIGDGYVPSHGNICNVQILY
ncbi:MBL fold metallo-hydrolase [Dolichospermum circinale]|uniref:MBL fold metallo-hydrolase n=1 Tax=Dolichospermum circinale TaxID=109265 RepID=UPI00232D720E|nr:MBL fold metallo-hydrolase [Dolichospermum circinale]MDB9452032.1 MBL fold metallo-hydrolase [Dolichospermum circinale CS-547]